MTCIMTRRIVYFVAFLLLSLANQYAGVAAEVDFGLFTFDDRAFATHATQLDAGSISPYGGATTLDEALTGFSPNTGLTNIGYGGSANHFQLDFDARIRNGDGDDFVLFDTDLTSRGQEDPYEIAVRTQGGDFTNYVSFSNFDFEYSGRFGGIESYYGLPVNLDAFGLKKNAVVDAIRFRSLPGPNAARLADGLPQGDPVMVGATNFGDLKFWLNEIRSTLKPERIVHASSGRIGIRFSLDTSSLPVSLTDLAESAGFKQFNFINRILSEGGPGNEITIQTASGSPLPHPVFDPPVIGGRLFVHSPAAGRREEIGFTTPPDNLPFVYASDTPTLTPLGTVRSSKQLVFYDFPILPEGFLRVGDRVQFETQLVGQKENGEPVYLDYLGIRELKFLWRHNLLYDGTGNVYYSTIDPSIGPPAVSGDIFDITVVPEPEALWLAIASVVTLIIFSNRYFLIARLPKEDGVSYTPRS